MARKKKIKKYVLEYRSDGTREMVLWGPENLVDEMLLVDDINLETICLGVVVHRREPGSFYHDYNEALRDMERHAWIYTRFQEYLSKYYIPLSRGEAPCVSPNDDPLEFLDVMMDQHNLVYSFLGHKIQYYIQQEKEIPESVFIDFFYNDRVTDIFFDKMYGSIDYRGHEMHQDVAGQLTRSNYDRITKKHTLERTVERLEIKAKKLVEAIRELSEGLEDYKEDEDDYEE